MSRTRFKAELINRVQRKAFTELAKRLKISAAYRKLEVYR